MAYAARSDVEDWFGVENVKKWADLDDDGDAVKISARIDRALAGADATIDAYLRNGPYAIPFASPPPTLIVEVAARLAGVWLYEARGVADYNAETGNASHRLSFHRKAAESTLRDLRNGALRLNLTVKVMTPVVPDE